MIQVSLNGTKGFAGERELAAMGSELAAAHTTLAAGDGAGGEFTGWYKLPETYDRDEFSRVKEAAAKIREDSDALVVIGIGGSYLGARAALEFTRKGPEVYFAGNNISESYIRGILDKIKDKRFSVNVISKSGTTTEPAIAFRIFRKALEDRYGPEEAARRVYATTDAEKGALRRLAAERGYRAFTVPDDIGGRFSVLTAVGLLPCAAAGLDIDALMDGAREAMEACAARHMDNPAWTYAGVRNLLYRKGYKVEVLACYEPAFRFMGEWWKQLFGESEGKRGLGIFPASVDLTADLHSMGQYIQEGERFLQETVVTFERSGEGLNVEACGDDGDGLAYLEGTALHEINRQASRGTMLAHNDGGVPVTEILAGAMDERTLGQLIYVFELACGLSGYVLGVNPFDQPGVEAYKKNMFALLGKPGFEESRAKLLARLS